MKEITKYRLYHWLDRYLGIPFLFLLYPLVKFSRKPKNDYKEILIIKLGMLGDAILLIPALRALREKFVNARISVLCSQANIRLFDGLPLIDEVIKLNFSALFNPFFLAGLVFKLRRKKFDLAIDFEQWSRISAMIAFLSGAGQRIGFKTPGQHRHCLFTKVILHIRQRHELDCFLDLLKPLGIEGADRTLRLWPKNSDIAQAEKLLEEINSGFLVIHSEVPASGRQRQWPLENFSRLGEMLANKHNLKIVIVSTKKGIAEAQKLNSLLRNRASIISDIPLLVLYSLLPKAKMVVTNNTGFMHLAASSGAKVVALHGPTSALKWGPIGKDNIIIKSSMPCSPCLYLGFEYGCKTNKCMQDIKVDEVLQCIRIEDWKNS